MNQQGKTEPQSKRGKNKSLGSGGRDQMGVELREGRVFVWGRT